MRRATCIVLACALAACGGEGTPPPAPPNDDLGRSGSIDPTRACGEAGAVPTVLPPALGTGMRTTGDAVVGPGETAHAGGVEARYDEHAWIGTMEVGYRGPALALQIDRAEVGEHEPWGGQIELGPGITTQTFIGAYRIDVRASRETPPSRVSIHVERRACPDHAVITDPRLPISMWVSTEAMRLQTVIEHGRMLQVGTLSLGDAVVIEVNASGWRHRIDPQPGVVRALRIDDRVITIDRVEPGAGTRFQNGAWRTTDGSPGHLHARVRIEAAPPSTTTQAHATAAPCGGPTTARTTLPSELRDGPAMTEEATIAAGEHRVIGGVPLDATTDELPARPGPGHEPTPTFVITSSALVPSSISFGAFGGNVQLARAERALLVFEAEALGTPTPRAHVRSFALACPRTLATEVPTEPTYLWLSTLGTASVTVGSTPTPALRLDVYADPTRPGLGVTSEHAYDSQMPAPEIVGHVATMDGLRIEIVDVVAGEGTRRTQYAWESDGPAPAVHVQVRIAPD